MHTYHRLFHLPHHKQDKLTLLYLISTIRTFIVSIINIFAPLLLIKQFSEIGYGNKATLIMTGLFLFYLLFVMAVTSLLSSNLISKFGIKAGFIIAHTIFIGFLISSQIKFSLIMGIFNYSLWGISLGFWWNAYHIYFVEMGKNKHFGEAVSIMECLGIAAGMIGPIIGGIILTYFGYPQLLLFCTLFIFGSLIVLFFGKNKTIIPQVKIHKVFELITIHKRDFISFVGAGGVDTIYTCIWPIFLFLLVKSYIEVGLIFTGIAVITFFILLVIAKVIDSISKTKMERIGSGIVATTWIGRVLFQNSPLLLVFDAIYRIFYNSFFIVPLLTIAYNHAAHEEKVHYVLFRELCYRIGDLIALGLFIFFVWIDVPLWSIFIIAALLSLLPFIEKE